MCVAAHTYTDTYGIQIYPLLDWQDCKGKEEGGIKKKKRNTDTRTYNGQDIRPFVTSWGRECSGSGRWEG